MTRRMNEIVGSVAQVMNITDVVAACRDTGLDWLEQLLQQMFRPKEDKEDVTKVSVEPSKPLLVACQQIVDCLVENILRLEEASLTRAPNSGTMDQVFVYFHLFFSGCTEFVFLISIWG